MLKMHSFLSAFSFRKADSSGQTPLTIVLPSGTHWSAESTEAILIKGSAQGHNIAKNDIL